MTTTLYPSGTKSQSQSFFNATNGKPSAEKQWDFVAAGQSFSTSPDQETDYAYTGNDLQQVTVVDQGGQRVNQTIYTYTSNATSAGNLSQHGSVNAGGPYLQTTSEWVNTSGATLDQTFAYDDAGTLRSTSDPNGTTSYDHDATDIFVTGVHVPTPSSGVGMATSAEYDVTSGVLLKQIDQNGVKTTYSAYDAFSRPGQVDVQDANGSSIGKTVYSYYSPNQTGIKYYQNTGVYADTETLYDEYGRLSRTAVFNGQNSNPWYQQDTCYDTNSRVSFQSNRYQGPGWGVGKVCSDNAKGTSTTYDAMDRPTSVANADGTASLQYSDRAVRKTDVNGVQTISQVDAFGRPKIVCEISSSSLAGQSPTACGTDIAGTGYVTSYSYEPANHKTTIYQGGRNRTFVTDSIGRTTFTAEPERGETSYSYSYNGVGLQTVRSRSLENQGNPAAQVQTTTQYDSLGRVASVSYNDGYTPSKNYFYDQSYNLGFQGTSQNVRGRLAGTISGSAGTLTKSQLSYDGAGHVTTMWQCAPSVCGNSAALANRFPLQFAYDWVGNLTYAFDGASGGIVYQRSPAGEVTSITNQTYTDVYNPPNLVSNVTNGPFGPTNYSLGNGTSVVRTYDALGRLHGGWLCAGNGGQGTTQYCNGNTQLYGFLAEYRGSRVTSMCDVVMNQCQGHGYDEFNRLTDVSGSVSYHYRYDRWGNRTDQIYDNGGPNYHWDYNNNNRISNYPSVVIDVAGNQVHTDSGDSFIYDAEGNVIEGWKNGQGHTHYIYDAFNNRVSAAGPSGTNDFLFDPAGKRYSSWIAASNTGNEGRIYWDGQLFANRSQNGTTYFHHSDWLGTERLRTNYQGGVVNLQRSLASGELFTQVNDPQGASQDNAQFTGQEYDDETSTDHFQFRQYEPTQGRWLSPDPYDGSMSSGDPQSLNRYTYVSDNPFGYTDPLGLSYCGVGGRDGSSDVKYGELAACIFTFGLDISKIFPHRPKFTASHKPRPGAIWDERGSYKPHPYSGLGDIFGLNNSRGCEFGACGSSFFQNTRVHGPWTYGNWCGAGGMGTPINAVDALCMAHDLHFGKTGADWTNMQSEANWTRLRPDQQWQVQQYNQQLCDGVAKASIPWWNASEKTAAWEIGVFFHSHVPKGAQCH